MADDRSHGARPLAQSPEDLRILHQLCRDGRLYDVERWIAGGKPLQVTPESIRKGTRPKTALQIALESGQHSLASLLLRSGYRLELEGYAPLDLTLRARRLDLFDLLLEWGADLKTVDADTVLDTYNVELYERFREAGYDLTADHALGSSLGHGTRNRPLLGFAKRYRAEDPKIQAELNIALGYHAREGNEGGVSLCLWAGADPHAPAPDPRFSSADDENEEGEDSFIGWSAVEEAARQGHVDILKRLRPDPARDNFDHLYQLAESRYVIAFLATIQPPKDLTAILSWQLRWLEHRFPWSHRSTGAVETLLGLGVQWEESDSEQLTNIRRSLLKLGNYDLKTIMSRLRRSEICAPETYQQLIRTPKMFERLLALGLVNKPVSEQEERKDEFARLARSYDRALLYEQVWSKPAQEVAKLYGVSGVRLGKVCRGLQVPVPPRGYWARLRGGYKMRRPALPKITGYELRSSEGRS